METDAQQVTPANEDRSELVAHIGSVEVRGVRRGPDDPVRQSRHSMRTAGAELGAAIRSALKDDAGRVRAVFERLTRGGKS